MNVRNKVLVIGLLLISQIFQARVSPVVKQSFGFNPTNAGIVVKLGDQQYTVVNKQNANDPSGIPGVIPKLNTLTTDDWNKGIYFSILQGNSCKIFLYVQDSDGNTLVPPTIIPNATTTEGVWSGGYMYDRVTLNAANIKVTDGQTFGLINPRGAYQQLKDSVTVPDDSSLMPMVSTLHIPKGQSLSQLVIGWGFASPTKANIFQGVNTFNNLDTITGPIAQGQQVDLTAQWSQPASGKIVATMSGTAAGQNLYNNATMNLQNIQLLSSTEIVADTQEIYGVIGYQVGQQTWWQFTPAREDGTLSFSIVPDYSVKTPTFKTSYGENVSSQGGIGIQTAIPVKVPASKFTALWFSPVFNTGKFGEYPVTQMDKLVQAIAKGPVLVRYKQSISGSNLSGSITALQGTQTLFTQNIPTLTDSSGSPVPTNATISAVNLTINGGVSPNVGNTSDSCTLLVYQDDSSGSSQNDSNNQTNNNTSKQQDNTPKQQDNNKQTPQDTNKTPIAALVAIHGSSGPALGAALKEAGYTKSEVTANAEFRRLSPTVKRLALQNLS